MAELLIPNLEEATLQQLQGQAAMHGRTAEAEARLILEQALKDHRLETWARINAFRQQLAASGRDFGDSAVDVREDRER